MSSTGHPPHEQPVLPGVLRGRRFRPRIHWELVVCGLRGHELAGVDMLIDERHSDFAIDRDGVRWHRCLRCDSWLPFALPAQLATAQHAPQLEELDIPLRGRGLRDKIVLRVIAVDRGLHFVVLGVLAALIYLVQAHMHGLRAPVERVLRDVQQLSGGAATRSVGTKHGVVADADKFFNLDQDKIQAISGGVAIYALLEGVEAVGLWLQLRWAEYLTLIATAVFLPVEVYELTHGFSPTKAVAFVINLAIVIYLLFAKRLFGLHGGAAAEHAARTRDNGPDAIRRSSPQPTPEVPRP